MGRAVFLSFLHEGKWIISSSFRASTKIRMRCDKRSGANGNCKAENTNVKDKWFL